ncbi:MAG: NPCBM/NEW2 domain-containing protein [Planctomycetales bacterium]|nr:NPCBM/NEW2 domain-containing protein [Planctomycetales bacterium]
MNGICSRTLWLVWLALVNSVIAIPAAAEVASLGDLDLTHMEIGWGQPQRDLSVDGNPLSIGGRDFDHGVGAHADGALVVQLDGQARKFGAWVGIDDEVGRERRGSAEFLVMVDDQVAFRSGLMRGGDAAQRVDVPLAGAHQLVLHVLSGPDGDNYDHADWADATIEYQGEPPATVAIASHELGILTPAPGPAPRVTGPRVFGARPGNPLLHRVTATGTRPLNFQATGLPPGVKFDESTGQLTGRLAGPGSWDVTVTATNDHGSDQRTLTIKGGELIALTPPMGWNSWNCFAHAVNETDIRNAAQALVDSGLADHGWTYVNIDDFWQVKPSATDDPTLQGPARDDQGRILPNPRFSNMKALADDVHALGLKIGIYSSPGPLTCGGCIGSFDHEFIDAKTYADWGFDYLKHDWCSYRPELERQRTRPVELSKRVTGVPGETLPLVAPYDIMRQALDAQQRDIVYSLCQYGMGHVSQWGALVGGNCWRTTGDIVDTWSSMSGIGFGQAGLQPYAEPGHWNDPDMLVVGQVGWGPNLHPTRLTPNEQYTHVSLWSLLSAPLLIGCDLTKLDDFTLNLLANDEVLEVNQDPLGKQAAPIDERGLVEVWAKPMEDGSWAVGAFNRGVTETEAIIDLSKLGLAGKVRLRDLWRQEDLPTDGHAYRTTLPRHGCVLLRAWSLEE